MTTKCLIMNPDITARKNTFKSFFWKGIFKKNSSYVLSSPVVKTNVLYCQCRIFYFIKLFFGVYYAGVTLCSGAAATETHAALHLVISHMNLWEVSHYSAAHPDRLQLECRSMLRQHRRGVAATRAASGG